jgi:hypothetical protein
VLSSTGGLRLNPESAEGKQVKAEDERRREEQRQRREAEEREAETLAEIRQDYEREQTVSIDGHRVHPADVRVNGR